MKKKHFIGKSINSDLWIIILRHVLDLSAQLIKVTKTWKIESNFGNYQMPNQTKFLYIKKQYNNVTTYHDHGTLRSPASISTTEVTKILT